MGLLKLSLVSLKKDLSKSVFYFLTFLLTTIFIFSFFNLVFNPHANINLGKDDSTFVTPIAVFVIVIAMVCVFLANNFYVSNKSKEISIILMSGASVYRLGIYLFFQVFIIMLLAIPLGCLLGYALIPVINSIFASTFVYQGSLFYLSNKTIVATAMILGFEVFWCSLVNLGYCVRSTINSIIQEKNKINFTGLKIKGAMWGYSTNTFELVMQEESKTDSTKKKGTKISDKIYLLLYILPTIIFIFLRDSMSFLMFSLIGIIGIFGIIKKVLPDFIKRRQHNQSLENPVHLISLGFFQSDIQKVFGLLIIMLLSSILLTCVTVYTLNQPLVSMVSLMSYISVMVLMSLTIVFKIGMELNKRKKNFQNLCHLGYSIKQLKQIIQLEMQLFYGLILVLPLIYQIIILSNLLFTKQITIYLMIIILIIQITPVIISYFISVKLYTGIVPISMIDER